jgi:hypothetical protein
MLLARSNNHAYWHLGTLYVRYTGKIMGRNRIHRFFENADRLAEFAIPSPVSAERAASMRAAGAGKSQSAFLKAPLRPQALRDLPFGAACDAARPPVKGWCNYSI